MCPATLPGGAVAGHITTALQVVHYIAKLAVYLCTHKCLFECLAKTLQLLQTGVCGYVALLMGHNPLHPLHQLHRADTNAITTIPEKLMVVCIICLPFIKATVLKVVFVVLYGWAVVTIPIIGYLGYLVYQGNHNGDVDSGMMADYVRFADSMIVLSGLVVVVVVWDISDTTVLSFLHYGMLFTTLYIEQTMAVDTAMKAVSTAWCMLLIMCFKVLAVEHAWAVVLVNSCVLDAILQRLV